MPFRPSAPLRIGDVALPSRVWVAPMTGVSDLPFRRACVRAGATYVATEMVACADLARGRPEAVRRAAVGEGLPLTVIQLLGADPERVAQGARMAQAAGADIVDLNFGCPAKEVTGSACGSALMRDLDLAERIVAAAAEAVTRPVTVKMRLGWDDASRNAAELAHRAVRAGARGFTVHGRTRSQFYTGVADWTAVAEVKAMAGALPVAVNGDIVDAASARAALQASGADALMLGRGVYGRPWAAAAIDRALRGEPEPEEPQGEARLAFVLRHLNEALAFHGEAVGLRVFRKHLGWYVESAATPADPAARRAARSALCRLETAREVEAALVSLWLGEAPPLARAA